MKQYFLQIFKFIMILLSKCFALIKKLFRRGNRQERSKKRS